MTDAHDLLQHLTLLDEHERVEAKRSDEVGKSLLETICAGKDSDVEKAAAVHRDYGAVFMTGRRRGERDFVFLRGLDGKLSSAGAFSVERLRFP